MNYYKDNDPRNTLIWEMMNLIQEKLKSIELIIDEYACDIDDGYHWIRVKVEEE